MRVYPNLSTVLNRGNTNSGAYVIQMAGATNVTLENLQLTGGQDGLYAGNSASSTGLTVSNCTLVRQQPTMRLSSTPATPTPLSSAIPSTTQPIRRNLASTATPPAWSSRAAPSTISLVIWDLLDRCERHHQRQHRLRQQLWHLFRQFRSDYQRQYSLRQYLWHQAHQRSGPTATISGNTVYDNTVTRPSRSRDQWLLRATRSTDNSPAPALF